LCSCVAPYLSAFAEWLCVSLMAVFVFQLIFPSVCSSIDGSCRNVYIRPGSIFRMPLLVTCSNLLHIGQVFPLAGQLSEVNLDPDALADMVSIMVNKLAYKPSVKDTMDKYYEMFRGKTSSETTVARLLATSQPGNSKSQPEKFK